MPDIICDGNKYEWEYDLGHIVIRKNGYFFAELYNEKGYQHIKSPTSDIAIPNKVIYAAYERKGLDEGQKNSQHFNGE